MKQRSFPLVLLSLLILTCFTLQSNALASSSFTVRARASGMVNYPATPEDGWLHTDGIWVKDSAGRKVAMRGIHIGWYYFEGADIVTQSLVDIAKSHGATYIDIGWHLRAGEDGYLDLARLDKAIDLCEANNIYVVLNYLTSSAILIRDGDATGWQDVIPIDTWKTIIQRYADRLAVVGVKLIDEANFNADEERQMWTQAIETLRPYNPNLLWFTHIITYLRFSGQYAYLNPWQTISQVPENVLVDAGCWVGQEGTDYPENCGLDDYDTADVLVSDLLTFMQEFQAKVPIPTGMAYGTDSLDSDNARTYALRESGRQMEQQHLYRTYYISEYFWRWSESVPQGISDRLLPDAPYPNYW